MGSISAADSIQNVVSLSAADGARHKVVCIDAYLCPVPKFDFPHEYVEYDNTIGEDLTIERVKDASIVITTRALMTPRTLDHCKRLEFIAVMGAGTNFLDITACRERKIVVCNCPSASAESVAEHAFALYFAAKRRIVELHNITLEGKRWPEVIGAFQLYPQVPRVSRHETLGIIGYGGLGKGIETIGKALGMSVLIAERKSVPPAATRQGRIAFDEIIKTSTVLMIGCPLDDETRNMITEVELQQMRPDSVIINVARGGIVNEQALVKALEKGWIASAATDVFEIEPATLTSSPLLQNPPPNLTVSPHVAWYADKSRENLQTMIKALLEGFVVGKLQNLVT